MFAAALRLSCLRTVNLKPFRMKTTYLLYSTTFLGYVVGKTFFGAIAPVKK